MAETLAAVMGQETAALWAALMVVLLDDKQVYWKVAKMDIVEVEV